MTVGNPTAEDSSRSATIGTESKVLRLLDPHREPDRLIADFLAERPGGHKLARERSLVSHWVRGFQAADPTPVSERAMAEGASPGDERRSERAGESSKATSLDRTPRRRLPDIRLGAVVLASWERGRVTVAGSAGGESSR